jgi:hypothetical protein
LDASVLEQAIDAAEVEKPHESAHADARLHRSYACSWRVGKTMKSSFENGTLKDILSCAMVIHESICLVTEYTCDKALLSRLSPSYFSISNAFEDGLG